MSIKLQIKNFAKLLLIGAVLFVICSAVSAQVAKCVSAKSNDTCQVDIEKSMFAQADEQTRPESPSYLLVGDACVKAAVPPIAVTPKVLGAIVGDAQDYAEESASGKAISEYEVKEGDTILTLAEKFGVSSDTILWANDLSKGATVKPGQKLIIPPVTGVVHYAVSGDTIAKIAQIYKASVQDIVAFNELSGEEDIFIGDVLVVPGGKVIPVATSKKYAQTPTQSAGAGIALTGNYFLCPVGAPCRKTQGTHFRNAVDLTAGYCGAPIYAAASGTVSKAKLGWNGGAGNNITISHMGGTIITHYYHLQSLLVSQGQEVKKGDVVGLMGTTGKSTGCHLHFEVIGATNPFNK
jgi:lysostaphin